MTSPGEESTGRRSLWRDLSGSSAIMFGIGFPVLGVASAGALQYAYLVEQRNVLQGAADSAALGGATELNLANATSGIPASATAMARTSLGPPSAGVTDTITAELVNSDTGVKVTIRRSMPPFFGNLLGAGGLLGVEAHAIAHVVGSSTPICIIGLDRGQKGTISLDTNAVVQATGCAAYSDSNHPWSISSVQNAVLRTALTCAVGGKQGNFPNFAPQPLSGCPSVADPLASRPAPAVGACDWQNLTVTRSVTLSPGVYCGGLRAAGAVTITLSPGTYVVTGGPLTVTDGATLAGNNVGFFLSGAGAVVDFEPNSTISLTAPKTGSMAGLLFFEDRANPGGALHQILSNNAQTLLGTIYLPRGRFFVGANAPVAGNSAYTIVVADTVELSAGPTLVLNAAYGSTDIPAPAGLGNHSRNVRMSQ